MLPSSIAGFSPGTWVLGPNEAERLAALRELDILDSAAEAAFDHIALFGTQLFDVPICLVSLVDESRQWFKACYGLCVSETSRDSAFCGHAVLPGAP